MNVRTYADLATLIEAEAAALYRRGSTKAADRLTRALKHVRKARVAPLTLLASLDGSGGQE